MAMIQWLAGVQPVLVGGVLLWAGVFKLLPRSAPAARRSALSRLVGKERAVLAFGVVGVLELAVAAAVLLPFAYPVGAVAGAVWSLALLGYLSYARLAAPDSSCGCLSTRHTPVTWRGFARAGLLVAASALAVFGGVSWPEGFAEAPLAAVAVLVVELAAVVALSPELDEAWLVPLRRFRVRRRHPLAGQPFEVPLDATVQQLMRSDAYRSVHDTLRSDLLDHWDEGEWRILTYRTRGATAVFAVPRLRYEPAAVRVALVEDAEQPVSTG